MKNPTTKNMIRLNSSERQKQKYTAEKILQREQTHTHIVHIDMPWRMCDSAHIFAYEIS